MTELELRRKEVEFLRPLASTQDALLRKVLTLLLMETVETVSKFPVKEIYETLKVVEKSKSELEDEEKLKQFQTIKDDWGKSNGK